MKQKNVLLALLLFSALGVRLCAQNPGTPDLSGTWKLNLEKSKLPKGSKIRSETIAITCSGVVIQMHYVTDGQESTQTYSANGKEKKINENQGGEVIAKAQWKGSILIIETSARLKLADQPLFNGTEVIHYKERWKLSSDGRVLTVETDEPKRARVYDKLPI